jgi:hypothetical protein
VIQMRFKSVTQEDLAPHTARFLRHLVLSGECLEWTLARKENGYGSFRISRSLGCMHAHKAAWIIANGAVPHGLYVCHTCDNRVCCNPAHLWLGTAKQNQQDMAAKGRVHSFAKANPAVQRDSAGRFVRGD